MKLFILEVFLIFPDSNRTGEQYSLQTDNMTKRFRKLRLATWQKLYKQSQTENTETDFFKWTAHEHSQALFKLLMLVCIFYNVYHPFVQQYVPVVTTPGAGQIHGFKPSQATTMKIHWSRQQCFICQLSLLVIKCSFIQVQLHFLVHDCQMWKSAQSSAVVAQKVQGWGQNMHLDRSFCTLQMCCDVISIWPPDRSDTSRLPPISTKWHFSNTALQLWVFI